jgi:type 2 lantibiotic biosynthesis protein LanM
LQALALRDQGEVSWIGLTALNDEFWSLAPAGLGLYDGLTGIGLFFLYLGAVTRDEKYASFALEIVHTVERHLDALLTDDKVLLGAFGPVGGAIYFLSHAGVVLARPDLLARAEQLAASARNSIPKDEHLDIIAGTAGFLASLFVLHHCRPSAMIVDTAIACGDHLLAKAETMPHGIGWPAPFESDAPLTGFSHGAAGISWTLAVLATMTGEPRFRQAAARGLAYERSLFNADAGNWPDLRRWRGGRDAGTSHLSNAWCHGAPGIGLSRLLIRSHLHDDQIDTEIRAAVRNTLAKGFGTNHSLCHGDLGNLDFLALTAKDANDASLATQVEKLAAQILAGMQRDGWICGSPQGVETPGLMVGLAGLGYGCLRSAEPTFVPSVLALAPPVVLCRSAPEP